MATVREGNKAALVVIDVQNDVVAQAWQRDEVVSRIASLAERARAEGVPIIYVQHHGGDMQQGSDGWQIVDEIAPRDGEAIIAKKYPDAFEETDLEGVLAKLAISHLVVTGAQTDACVRSTTHRALAEGYDMTLVADCHTTDDRGFDGVNISAGQLVVHINFCMQFVSYPDRVSGIAPHDVVSFTTPAGAQEN